MKKLLLWFLAAVFVLSNTMFARIEYDEDERRAETSPAVSDKAHREE